ncbi:uncharacterized protein BO88DRAFT_467914 [Aspergillus vadensis CBS 113365]|uniref:Uncharacterized protein n=1 Tax=Aspergillus vadensis (strain CBS 113365 / IMI 142717 / IBT 24658) TaxID=1448311 RepID=A0A319C537_ASPVC|nr:hypothetical protein BO88DRAFT_467914 [Aspergillus vadensis CBS 113365]PYH73433.1 hypothetical protein BO88DRAFT_467914 [Aspergillus vadensis CBS 113365]
MDPKVINILTWLATYPYQWLWESDTCLVRQGVGVPGSRTVGKRHSIAIRPIIAVAELGWTNGKDDMHGSSAGLSWSFPGRYAVCTCIYGIQSISVVRWKKEIILRIQPPDACLFPSLFFSRLSLSPDLSCPTVLIAPVHVFVGRCQRLINL